MSRFAQPRWLLLPAALLVPDPAVAAGGPHMIDDSEVETPGGCHAEGWVTRSSYGQWHASGGAGCTPEALPTVELGAFASHSSSPGSSDTLVGLTPKLTLRPAASGLGLALAGALGYGLDRSRLEAAALIGAVTVPAGDRLTLNLNGGWGWSETGHGHDLFVGAQAEFAAGPDVTLMAEAFTRDHGRAGAQAGLRWNPGGGRVDVDLLAGRYLDGATPTSVTLGLTVRP